MATGLRTSLIWHDEVMEDVVSERPAPITLGSAGDSTFVVPDLGLPPSFALVSPGRRGYLLTLGERMRGTICVGGVEHDVAELVRANGEGGFHALPIGGQDWGVVDLDETGHYKLFFQFVELEDQRWTLPRPVLVAGAIGYLASATALALLWWANGVAIGEALFRGAGIAALALGGAALARALMTQDSEARASLAFSIALHAALLFVTFQLYAREDPFVWPGSRALTGDYLITRISEPRAPVAPAAAAPAATISVVNPTAPPLMPAPAPRLRPPRNPPAANPPAPPSPPRGPGMLGHGDILDGVTGRDPAHGLRDRLEGVGPASGDEGGGDDPLRRGTRGGRGRDKTAGLHQETGQLSTGPLRAAVCTGRACGGSQPTEIAPPATTRNPDGDPTLTELEIDRVIRSRSSGFRTCYQRRLDKNEGLAGDIVFRFAIDTEGKVDNVRLHGGSLRDDEVIDCVRRVIQLLRFPAKGGATVTYPFVFKLG